MAKQLTLRAELVRNLTTAEGMLEAEKPSSAVHVMIAKGQLFNFDRNNPPEAKSPQKSFNALLGLFGF